MKPARPNSESGFALLFVFLMAALLAISLYMEMPRVAFEAQRAKSLGKWFAQAQPVKQV